MGLVYSIVLITAESNDYSLIYRIHYCPESLGYSVFFTTVCITAISNGYSQIYKSVFAHLLYSTYCAQLQYILGSITVHFGLRYNTYWTRFQYILVCIPHKMACLSNTFFLRFPNFCSYIQCTSCIADVFSCRSFPSFLGD